MKAYIINGRGTCGKDTFVDYIRSTMVISYATFSSKILNISSVKQIKDIATEYFGYYGQKTPAWRKALSDLKDIQTKMNDGPFKYMEQVYLDNKNQDGVIFFHVREPEEIKRLAKRIGATTILIRRPGLEGKYGNHADDGVENYEYDHVIENDGDLQALKNKTEIFVKNVIKG